MTLLSLLEESRADPAAVTIEATVVTGFEPVAMEECIEKVSETVNTALARGRIFFNVPQHKMDIVSFRFIMLRTYLNINILCCIDKLS
jgi:hypothetical protein